MKRYLFAFILALSVLTTAGLSLAADTPRAYTETSLPKNVVLFTWAGLDGDDTGIPAKVSDCRQLTVHVYSGTYGSSTVTVEGTNDPAYATSGEWVGLTDPQGNAISKTADGIEKVQELPYLFRPKSASGTSADIDVGLTCQK